jgi:hypothetical protein
VYGFCAGAVKLSASETDRHTNLMPRVRDGWLVDWLVDCLVGRLVDWLVGWLDGWLIAWLVGWLVV